MNTKKHGFDYLRLLAYGLAAACVCGYLGVNKKLSAQAALPEPETRALNRTEGNIGREPVYLLLRRNGLAEPQLGAAVAALKKRLNPREILPRDTYYIAVTTAGAFHRFTLTHNLKLY